MYAWTIHPRAPFDYDAFAADVSKEKRVPSRWLRDVRRCVDACAMRACLRDVVACTIETLEADARDYVAISRLVEFMAGYNYRVNDPTVGELKCIRRERCEEAARYLKDCCKAALRSEAWTRDDAWFHLRAWCMDAYALCRIVRSEKPTIIYYAGSAHTRAVSEYMQRRMRASPAAPGSGPPLLARVSRMCDDGRILHHEVLAHRGRTIVFVGESHPHTRMTFASRLVAFLKDHCATELDFLIEKHISNSVDALQQRLACDQRDRVAIHRSRCDAFVVDNACDGLRIHCVDNRHVDMGFLRMEIMDAHGANDALAARIREFNRCALRSMLRFCKTCLTQEEDARPRRDHRRRSKPRRA